MLTSILRVSFGKTFSNALLGKVTTKTIVTHEVIPKSSSSTPWGQNHTIEDHGGTNVELPL